MNLKDFLEKHSIINMSQLAKEMWPENNNPRIKLYNKLNEKKAGSGIQRVTEDDIKEAKRVLNKLAEDIKKL